MSNSINYYYKRNNRPKKEKKGKKGRSLLKTAALLLLVLFSSTVIVGVGTFAYFAKGLPDPSKISERKIAESTKIYDRTGEVLLYDIHGEERRTVISFDEIPQSLKDATIVAEDDNFYNHKGFDIKGIFRAFWVNLKQGGIRQGGSTITQQFVKLSILSSKRTYTRKVKESILSLEIERKYSKDEILGFYLNQIPYGSNAYGAEAAATTFFNKKASELTINESALLAALPNAPTFYSPYGNNQEKLLIRKNSILEKMFNKGYITEEEFNEAKEEELEFSKEFKNITAPHFVMYVKSYLAEKYGEEAIENDGFKITTTLDLDMQEKAEEVITEQSEINEENHNAMNAALVAIDPNTGEILTMVGSRDYFDLENDGNVNVTIRQRQPGSSFKPFAYAKAFEKGITPDTLLFDLNTEFNTNCSPDALADTDQYGLKCYHPQNYDLGYRGPITVKESLARSLNIPSVKMLYIAGVKETINLVEKMGIKSLTDPDRYGLSLVLGGGEVTLLEETSAYGVFATEGVKHPTRFILKIENSDGDVLEEFLSEEERGEEVMDKEIARQITSILSSNELRTPAFGPVNYLNLGSIPAAAKTGTTQEYRDAWTVGYTPNLVTGVWVGNNNNDKMYKAPGSVVASPIWNKFMKAALQDSPVISFNDPQPIKDSRPILNGDFSGQTYEIDTFSGKLATKWTPEGSIEEKLFPEAHNILHYINISDPKNTGINSISDSQFENWEAPVIEWAKEPYCSTKIVPIEGTDNMTEVSKCTEFNQEAPTEYDDTHTLENKPKITIISPRTQETYQKGDIVRIQINTESIYRVSQVDFFLDDELIGGDTVLPYSLSFQIPFDTTKSQYKIRIKAYDITGNTSEEEVTVRING